MRIMGIDYGTVRIGVAISDQTAIIAQPYGFIDAVSRKNCLEKISSLCIEYKIFKIIVGLPKHMSGEEGESAKAARKLGSEIEVKTGLTVEYLDERLTTVSAERALTEANIKATGKKDKIDSVAAAIILQNYLDMKEL